MRTVAVLGCLALLAASGCATSVQAGERSSSGSPTSTPAVVPWIDAPAPPFEEPTPPPPSTEHVTSCRATDLRVQPDSHFGAAAGTVAYRVQFVSTAAKPCAVTGYPTLTGVAADGRTTSLRPSHDGQDIGVAGVITRGQAAAVLILSSDGCDAALRGPRRTYPVLRIGLPRGGGSFDVPSHDLDLACGVRVSSFGVQGRPAPEPAEWLTATRRMPAQVRAGQIVHFTVTVRNTRAQAYPLTPCPAYETGFYANASTRVDLFYRLNCSTVHEIPPHGSVAYAMQLRAPAGVPAGTAMKFWWTLQMTSYRFDAPFVGGAVTVVQP